MNPNESKLVIESTVFHDLAMANYSVRIEVARPGEDQGFANPIERFHDLRVNFQIFLSVEDSQGEDGAFEPCLELFEPLIENTDQYYLPWNTPRGLKLIDSGKWGGWNAWLGTDHDEVKSNALEFLKVDGPHIFVRWSGDTTGNDGKPCPFLFEGALKIQPMKMYGVWSLDVASVISRLFGASQATMVKWQAELIEDSQIEGWTEYLFTQA